MKQYRALAILLAVTGLIVASGVVASQPPPSNTTRHTSSTDVVPQAGPLEIVQSIIDFVPGAASTVHYHSGTVHNTVLTGELTLRYATSEQRVGIGQAWTDAPGVVHQAVNLGSTPATVAAVFVQPKGAMVTVPVASLQSPGPPLPRTLPNTGDGSCADDLSVCE